MSNRATTPTKFSTMPSSQEPPSTPKNQSIKKIDAPPQLNRKLRVEPIPFAGNFDDDHFPNVRRRIDLVDPGHFADAR